MVSKVNSPAQKLPLELVQQGGESLKAAMDDQFFNYQMWLEVVRLRSEVDVLRVDVDLLIQKVAFVVREVSDDYQVVLFDDAVIGDTDLNVTLIPIAEATVPIIITSTNGVMTMFADTDIQGSEFVTNNTSAELYPALGKWWRR